VSGEFAGGSPRVLDLVSHMPTSARGEESCPLERCDGSGFVIEGDDDTMRDDTIVHFNECESTFVTVLLSVYINYLKRCEPVKPGQSCKAMESIITLNCARLY